MYVAKSAYNPAPLKMEKRLSGDLSKITQPMDHQEIKINNDEYIALKNAVSVLESLRYKQINNNADIRTLQLVNQQLSEKASVQPEIYLPAVSTLRKIISQGRAKNADISTVEKAIQKILIEYLDFECGARSRIGFFPVLLLLLLLTNHSNFYSRKG